MTAPRVLASGLHGAIGCAHSPTDDRLYYVEYSGSISSVDGNGHVKLLGSGYDRPEGIAITADGATAYVAVRTGSILRVDLALADAANASEVISGLDEPQQIALREGDAAIFVIEYGAAGRLLRIDLASGSSTVVAASFDHGVGLVLSADGATAYVSEQAAPGGRISRVDVVSGAKAVLVDGLVAPFFLAWLDEPLGELLVCERDPANRVTKVAPDGTTSVMFDPTPVRPSCCALAGGQVYVTTEADVVAYDVDASGVRFEMPPRALFIGEYHRVGVDVSASPVPFDDLRFVVAEGPTAGGVSLSRDATFDPARPEIMLLAAGRGGTFTLQALTPADIVVGEDKFDVSELWQDDDRGPSLWFNGIVPGYAAGPTWGGGPVNQPQNLATIPATGTRKVAIIFCDTASARYTANTATFQGYKDTWRQHAVDGFVGGDGVSRSVAKYYWEVSYHNLKIEAQVFPDPVALAGVFGDYFDTTNGAPKQEFGNSVIAAAPAAWNLAGFDMYVFVSQPDTSAVPAEVAWPYGGFGIDVQRNGVHLTGRGVSMPYSWGDGSSLDEGGGRTIYETLTHEMGHTISLPDEYTPGVAGRNLGDWDPMCFESTLPHMTLAHRMMLGWVDAGWLALYNFQATNQTHVNENVTLTPIEKGAPPASKKAGVEVRLGNGRNYYFEYRKGQAAQIGDRNLGPDDRIVGVDVSEPPDPPVTTRPDMLLLAKHGNDDGAVLGVGGKYRESDVTTPTHPADFTATLMSANGNEAVLNISYGIFGKPDPSIRPWPRSALHQWQSPDIEVTNPKTMASPMFANVPWAGHPNTVTATITNDGDVSAPGVTVNFYVKDYTVGGAPETWIGSDTQDIAVGPGATHKFTTSWTPPADTPAQPQHYCIIARIDSYETPTSPPVHERTEANNSAQSNYDLFISSTASPPSREIAAVAIGNPYDQETIVHLRGGQDNPLYRIYLEHKWLRLAAHETRQVRVMVEYAPDAPIGPPQVAELRKRFLKRPSVVNLHGLIVDPDDRRHGPKLMQGATIEIHTGRATRIDKLAEAGERGVRGHVVTRDDGRPVRGGTAVLAVTARKRRTYVQAPLKDGWFSAELPAAWTSLTAHYVPPAGYGESERTLRHG